MDGLWACLQKLFTLKTRGKHGKNKKWHETDEKKRSKVDEGQMHHNTRPYTRYLTDAEKQHVIDQQYAIPAKAVKKYDKQHGQGALASEIKKRPFTPLLFLVRRQERRLHCTPSHAQMPWSLFCHCINQSPCFCEPVPTTLILDLVNFDPE